MLIMYYATLYQVKRYTGNLDNTTEDARFVDFLRWSTGLIEGYKARRYDVRLATIPHDAPITVRSSFGVFDRSYVRSSSQRQLIVVDDLLEMVEFLNGDGVEITSDEFMLEPFDRTPYSVLTLRSGTTWSPDDNGDIKGALSLKAFWGYHSNYANAFIDSLDTVLDNPLTANATQIHVDDVNGATEDLDTPRFQAGQLLRIGDELMLLLAAEAVQGNNDTLTVKRAYNGSVRAQHSQGASIKIFRPEETIVQACQRLVKWRYAQKDSDAFDRTYVAGTGVVSTPASLPADVRDVLGAKGKPRR
jgi:hypothetical protein